jgi:hypothetical protein
MAAIMEWLNGKKTYIVVIVGAVVDVLIALNVIPADGQAIQIINVIFLALFGAALRAGVTKSGPQ